MGTGINGVIPLTFKLSRFSEGNKEAYFCEGFFENYDYDETTSLYSIKQEIVASNFSDFLTEFYDLIHSDPKDRSWMKLEELSAITTIESFYDALSSSRREYRIPYISDEKHGFSASGCHCVEYCLFYSGSYKAYLESECTLEHFERALSKAMTNPLGKAIKMGMYG